MNEITQTAIALIPAVLLAVGFVVHSVRHERRMRGK
jgi:hypothetical protein